MCKDISGLKFGLFLIFPRMTIEKMLRWLEMEEFESKLILDADTFSL